MGRMIDSEEVLRIAERLRPVQEALERAQQRLDPTANRQELLDAMFQHNEEVDALMPRLARAAGVDVVELRQKYCAKEDFYAYFDGRSSDYLARVARYRTLEPPDWVVGRDVRMGATMEARIPRTSYEDPNRQLARERSAAPDLDEPRMSMS